MGSQRHRSKLTRLAIGAALALTAGCAPALRMAHVPAPASPGFLRTVAAVSASTLTRGRSTGFWYTPDAIYAARLEAVKSARRTIHFETYFMTPGKRADDFARALVERAKAGVKVSFLADADGTKYLPRRYFRHLRRAGIEVRFYHPLELSRPWRYDTRTHRKLLLVDGKLALTGGTGVSDHWDGLTGETTTPPWADTEVRLTGPVVNTLEGVFAQHWLDVGGRADLSPEVYPALDAEAPPMLITPSSPSDGDSPVRALYQAGLVAARKRIWIASPYFLPSKSARQALIRAHRRGVDVRILSVGPNNDQCLIWHAVRCQAAELVAAGVRIFEYQPAMMHAKLMLVDDRWTVVGSANFDPRSFYHNDELMVGSEEPALAEGAEAFFQEAFAKSEVLTLDTLQCQDRWCDVQGRLTLLFKWFL